MVSLCQSPIEERWQEFLWMHLDDRCKVRQQVECRTIGGLFFIDFVVDGPDKSVAFECDGKEFHDAYRDEWRDACLLGGKHIPEMIRLRGIDIYRHVQDCLYMVSAWHPWMISERSKVVLSKQAKDETLAAAELDFPCGAWVTLDRNRIGEPIDWIFVRRYGVEGREMWQEYYQFVAQNQGLQLDAIIEKWKAK